MFAQREDRFVVSVVLVGDLHLSDRPPSQCGPEYNDQLFRMLQEVIALSSQHDGVVFAGDLFHLKRPDRTSHRTVQRMIDVVQSINCPVHLVVGNHDIQYGRVESIYETQPFGTLLQAGAHLLDGWDRDLPLYGIPWQQDWQNPGDVFSDWLAGEGDARYDSLDQCLLVTHAPLYPPGRENPFECILASDFAAAVQEGFCYYGHVHECHGTYMVDGVTFCNQGALSRGSLQEEDLTRQPAVTVWHSGRVGEAAFERVELASAPPASEVFRIAEAAVRVDHRDRLEGFLEAVGRSQVAATSVEAVLAHLQTLELSEADRSLAEEVLAASVAGELR